MAKILISGAQGLLGCALVPHLKLQGHEVVQHGRNTVGEVRAELTDTNEVGRVLDEVSPDVIVNLAALTNVDECERHPQQAYLANVKIVENIALWIKNHGGGCHLVQLSTDQVYDGQGPHKECDVTLTNCYGFSKYAGELAASVVSGTVLRTNFFGRSQNPCRQSFSDWLVRSLALEEDITVFDDVCFSPLSLLQLVQFLELVIVKRKPGIYNLGSKDSMSKADFAYSLAECLSLPTKKMKRGLSSESSLVAYRPKDMSMNSSRFEESFGVELPSLREEIQLMKGAYDDGIL